MVGCGMAALHFLRRDQVSIPMPRFSPGYTQHDHFVVCSCFNEDFVAEFIPCILHVKLPE
jgi:hypothetical protein